MLFRSAHSGRVKALVPELKKRAKDLNELAENAKFLAATRPLALDAKAQALLSPAARGLLARLAPLLAPVSPWTLPAIEGAVRAFADAEHAKLGDVAQPIRAALTGKTVSPGVFEVMAVLGRDESLGRIGDAAA